MAPVKIKATVPCFFIASEDFKLYFYGRFLWGSPVAIFAIYDSSNSPDDSSFSLLLLHGFMHCFSARCF